MADTNTPSGSSAGRTTDGATDGTTDGTSDETTPENDVDPGAEQVRTPPLTETDPLLVHVGESINEAKEAAHEVFGEHGLGSDDDVDPNLGTDAPVP